MWLFDEIRNIPDIIRYWASKNPHKVALIDGSTTRTYAELDRRSNGLANRMLRMGVQRGSNVGFFGKNSMEFFDVSFSASKIACPLAPFHCLTPAEDLIPLITNTKTPL